MNTEELKQNIKERHENLFPNATLETQLKKFSEEWEEFRNADEDGEWEELADMFIVAVGLSRFNETASNMAHCVVNSCRDFPYGKNGFYRDVLRKMEINEEKREWVDNNGEYDHKEGE